MSQAIHGLRPQSEYFRGVRCAAEKSLAGSSPMGRRCPRGTSVHRPGRARPRLRHPRRERVARGLQLSARPVGSGVLGKWQRGDCSLRAAAPGRWALPTAHGLTRLGPAAQDGAATRSCAFPVLLCKPGAAGAGPSSPVAGLRVPSARLFPRAVALRAAPRCLRDPARPECVQLPKMPHGDLAELRRRLLLLVFHLHSLRVPARSWFSEF